ncbi:hypothetical protein EST38_g2908 [Candolleomyces aberdarensis]|uniref:Uncharacterized protein n=1 Tax=Candolleomyces aberdarensis TaxID=2316362 RepID=A0A4Q2DRU6_9AGAR|nr:hypothetical protein EST38_g2908 [Candolleomyces aberdarensis]
MILENFTLCSPRPSVNLKEADPKNPIVVRSTIDLAAVAENHVVIKVDRFGFSANNVTYQALGEHPHFRYFDFHPAPTSELARTHGLIPVWGFGTVVASTHSKIHVGERVYGYLAPTRYLVVPVSKSDVNKHAFYVPRPHLPEGSYKTSDDGKLSILISSASSKTAFSLAYLVQKRIRAGELPNVTVVGLTSKRNLGFTQRLGLYDGVYEYDTFVKAQAFQGDVNRRWLYVDVAGNADLNERVKSHFASPTNVGRIVKNVSLGATNLAPSASANDDMSWSHNAFNTSSGVVDDPTIRWPIVEHFFMPEWLNVRKHQLPISEIFRRQAVAWSDLMRDCRTWVQLERVYGAEKVRDDYIRIAKGGLGPDKGLIWSLWDAEVSSSKPLAARL